MAAVTNRARSPRGFHANGGKLVYVAPGETRELTLDSPNHPVIAAWVKAGHVEIVYDEVEPETAEDPETTGDDAEAEGASGAPAGRKRAKG
jgi:hypothetical protein